MPSLVVVIVSLGAEGHRAQLALVGPLVSVDAGVYHQVGALRELLIADGALVLPNVQMNVVEVIP